MHWQVKKWFRLYRFFLSVLSALPHFRTCDSKWFQQQALGHRGSNSYVTCKVTCRTFICITFFLYLNVAWPCYFQFTNLSKIENVEFLEQWFYGGLTDLQGLYIYNVDCDVQQNWSASSKKDGPNCPTQFISILIFSLIVLIFSFKKESNFNTHKSRDWIMEIDHINNHFQSRSVLQSYLRQRTLKIRKNMELLKKRWKTTGFGAITAAVHSSNTSLLLTMPTYTTPEFTTPNNVRQL